MRARFLPLSANYTAGVVRVDTFPAVLSLDGTGSVCVGGRSGCEPVCLLDEYAGNLIIKDHADDASVKVNELPIAYGPLMPGDTLGLGSHKFIVSYERVTSTPPPSATFHLLDKPRAAPSGVSVSVDR